MEKPLILHTPMESGIFYKMYLAGRQQGKTHFNTQALEKEHLSEEQWKELYPPTMKCEHTKVAGMESSIGGTQLESSIGGSDNDEKEAVRPKDS